jgi:rhodanese-related sulfurtransferase
MRVSQLDPASVAARLRAGDPGLVLLDCRDPDEVVLAAVAGAVHVPMEALPDRLGELDPGQEYFVLCHHGVRSHLVCSFLLQRGYPRVHNVRGGIDAWAVQVDPAVPRY